MCVVRDFQLGPGGIDMSPDLDSIAGTAMYVGGRAASAFTGGDVSPSPCVFRLRAGVLSPSESLPLFEPADRVVGPDVE